MPLTEQMMSMQATHDAFVAIQQVLACFIQLLETAVQCIERQRLYLYARHFKRQVFLGIRVTDVENHLTGQRLADFLYLDTLAQLLDHTLENRHVELLFFILHAVALGVGLGVDRNHPAVLRHVSGELGSPDCGGRIDDVLLVAGDQRTQHQLVRHRIDERQVWQRLAGNLGHSFTGYQYVDLQALGHRRSSAQHHTLQNYAHMTVIDFLENFSENFLERNADKQHSLRTAVLLPDEMRDFHHAQLVCTTTEDEEAEMAHEPAAHDLVGRNGGIETAGHQYQGLIQRTQRVAAEAVVLAVDHEQPFVANFHPHFDFGCLEVDPGCTTLDPQLAADVFFDVHRAEGVMPGTLATHRKDLARQCVAEVQFALGEDVIHIAKRVFIDLQEMSDARRAAQALNHLLQDFRLADPGR